MSDARQRRATTHSKGRHVRACSHVCHNAIGYFSWLQSATEVSYRAGERPCSSRPTHQRRKPQFGDQVTPGRLAHLGPELLGMSAYSARNGVMRICLDGSSESGSPASDVQNVLDHLCALQRSPVRSTWAACCQDGLFNNQAFWLLLQVCSLHACDVGRTKCVVLSALVAPIPGAFSDWPHTEANTDHSTATRISNTALCRSLYNALWA